MKPFNILLLFYLLTPQFLPAQQDSEWSDLFNRKNLDNFEQRNGTAEFRIEGNEIVGISKLNTPNSFLCTKKQYSDFILELEFKIHPLLNAGIQIRSQSIPEYHNGVVHGYQVEIDPSPRAYTGGIYDESRRGWLYPLTQNEAGRSAFRQGQWNHFRIEAIGKDIRVWLNGVNTANVVDDLTASGFIALQVHSISDSTLVGEEVRWRNLKIITTNLQKHRKDISLSVPEENFVANYLSPNELRQGWRLLWDGHGTEGWGAIGGGPFPEKGWSIVAGELRTNNTDITNSNQSIISLEKFHHFELKVSFKLSEGAQSGLKYLVDTLLYPSTENPMAFEYQLVDDRENLETGANNNRSLGSLFDLIPAENLSRPGVPKGFRGIDQWNEARITVNDQQIEHWLNGYKIVTYKPDSQMFLALLDHSLFAKYKELVKVKSGHILLQHKGGGVAFRSIKIRML